MTQGEIFTQIPSRSTEIVIYPNPTRGNLTIKSAQLSPQSRVRILSIDGKEAMSVRAGTMLEMSLTLPEDLAEGVYVLDIQNDGIKSKSLFALER